MESQCSQFAQMHPELDLLTGHGFAKLSGTFVRHPSPLLAPGVREGSFFTPSPSSGRAGVGLFPRHHRACVTPPGLASLGHPPRRRGGILGATAPPGFAHNFTRSTLQSASQGFPRLRQNRSYAGRASCPQRASSPWQPPPGWRRRSARRHHDRGSCGLRAPP